MIVVDTSVLVFATRSDQPEYFPCRRFLSDLLDGGSIWFMTWPIVYEFLRITTHRKVFARPFTLVESWKFVRVLIDDPMRL